jgi:iron complex transport system permease protein
VSVAARPRRTVAAALIGLAALAAAIAGLMLGDYPLSAGDVVKALVGAGDPGASFVVETLRLPRVVCALLVGGALGIAGAIFQSITRNPLGSPDVIGFTYGSAAGAVLLIVAFGASQTAVALGSIGAGLLTALAVYALAYRGGVQGYRLVLVGIGVGLMLQSVTTYLLSHGRLQNAQQAAVWIAGSLNGRGWDQATPLLVGMAALVPVALLLSRPLTMLELGDDAAGALGVPVERTRLALALVAVGLTALATAAAGPIAFVALAAPQIARRLTRASGPGLVSAALMGALLLQASDLLAQRLLAPKQLPVGVMTAALGGLYLAWLLAHEWRARRTA